MKSIKSNVKNELVITKSKFITFLYRVNTIDEINNYLDELKKEYKDATHHCYAYILNNTKKASDDKEPSGTAGMPILNVLEHNDLTNVPSNLVQDANYVHTDNNLTDELIELIGQSSGEINTIETISLNGNQILPDAQRNNKRY